MRSCLQYYCHIWCNAPALYLILVILAKGDVMRKTRPFNIDDKMCKLYQDKKVALMLYPEQ